MLLGLRLADDNCLLNMAMNEFMKAAIRAKPMPIDVFLLNCIVKSFCLPKRRCRFFPVNISPAWVRSLALSGSFIIRHSAAEADDVAVSRQPGWLLRGLMPGPRRSERLPLLFGVLLGHGRFFAAAGLARQGRCARRGGWCALRRVPSPFGGVPCPGRVFARRGPCPAGPVRPPGWVLRQHPGGGPPGGARLVRVWRAGQGRLAWSRPHSCGLSSSRRAPLRLARGHGWRSLRHPP